MKRAALTLLASLLAGAATAGAQVGYEPARSPFRDLDFVHEFTAYSGWYHAKRDWVDVAPRSGPIAGIHYEWRASGPLSVTADLSRLASERRVLDPDAPDFCNGDSTRSCKIIGDFRWPVYFAGAGMALNLTGARSYFGLVPQLKGGIGLATDFHSQSDVGDFAFGTRFAFHWGAGMLWLPGRRLQVRLDVINHLYSIQYPESYFRPANDNSQILPDWRERSVWLNNPSVTLGISYLFSR